MSAVAALRTARAAGLELEVVGDDLLLAASAPPSASILEMLSRHKAAVVALLRPGGDGWSAENWWSFFDETANIAERKGRLTRVQAEQRAFACCEVKWLNRNFVCSPPGDVLAVVAVITPMNRCCLSGSNPLGTSGCIHAAGLPGMPPKRPRQSTHWQQWGSRHPQNFQTISEKTKAHDGRLRIGTAERLRAGHGGRLLLDRREPAEPRGLPTIRLGGRLAMDTRRREGRLNQHARR